MVKFEFTVEDADAENLMQILRDEEWRMRDKAIDLCHAGHEEWYQQQAAYLKNLREKIAKSRTKV